MNTILERLRTNRSSSRLKKIFVGCLSLIAGCASATDAVVKSASAVTQASASQSGSLRLQDNRDSASDPSNPFGLPDLGISSSDTTQIQKKKDAIDPMLGAPSVGFDPASSEQRLYKSQDAKDIQALLMGMANTASTTAVKDWFSAHHATAKINVGMGEGGVRTGSFDLLVPLFDNKKDDLFFTQVGIRRSNQFSDDYRTTLNLGIGYRHQIDKWLLGVNSFYDRDMTGDNERLGLGAEAWTDNLKLSANSYLRLSDWKKSPGIDDYLERPANGWDIRAEAFLPNYPQLSSKVMYEKYYGEQVSLFGGSSRQKDPSASTLGLSYTPIPLVSISTDYRQGQNGLSETSMRIGINYRIGESWKQQLSPDQVRATRLLENSRYDLVSRRNDIVLDHKKIEHGSIILPNHMEGTSSTLLTFPVNLLGPSVTNFSWKGTAAAYVIPYGGGTTASIQLPVNSSPAIQSYSLQAVGVDSTGKVIESNMMMISVEPVHIALTASKTTGLSDGVDNIDFTAQLSNSSGGALPGVDVVWVVEGQATVTESDTKTNASGTARMRLFSRFANNVKVSVGPVNGAKTETVVTFVPDEANYEVASISSSAPYIIADGLSSAILTAIIHDSKGFPVKAGVKVGWKTDLGTLSSSTSLTDENGKASVSLSSTATGVANVIALGAKESSATVSVTFTKKEAFIASVTTDHATIVGNGVAIATLSTILHDAQGNPVGAGYDVAWTTTAGQLSSASSQTDASGKATISLSGTDEATATVTAGVTSGSSTISIEISADMDKATISLSATPSTTNAYSHIELIAKVTSASGKAIPDAQVSWTTTYVKLRSYDGILDNSIITITDADGSSLNDLHAINPGSYSVTATFGNHTATTPITVLPDYSSTKISALSASKSTISADGIETVILTATMTDGDGRLIGEGQPVTWTTSMGSLSSSSTMTNESSQATVSFTSIDVGIAKITAAGADSRNSTKKSKSITMTLP